MAAIERRKENKSVLSGLWQEYPRYFQSVRLLRLPNTTDQGTGCGDQRACAKQPIAR